MNTTRHTIFDKLGSSCLLLVVAAIAIACFVPCSASAEEKLTAGSADFYWNGSEWVPSDTAHDVRIRFSEVNDVGVDPLASDAAANPEEAPDATVADPNTTFTSIVSNAVFPFLPNPTTDEFIASIAEQAREIGQQSGLYASVMIAQAILESGSGSSGLSKPPYNNLFGIKGSYKGASVVLMTSEDDGSGRKYDIAAGFRRYPSVKESLQDYADLLTRDMAAYYAPAWKVNARTYVDACNYLQGHYATDTTYSGKLQGIILSYDLVQYDKPAGSASNKKEARLDSVKNAAQSVARGGTGVEGRKLAEVASRPSDVPAYSQAQSASDKGSADEPLKDPAVQVSLLSLGALTALFAKNEIALLLAAIKAHIPFTL